MLKHSQVKPYDEASKVIRECAEKLGQVNVAGFEIEHRKRLDALLEEALKLGAEMYALGYERFLAEKNGTAPFI